MASIAYNLGISGFGAGTYDWLANSFRCALITGSYTPNPDHTSMNDLVAHELSGGVYARSGDLTGKAVTPSNADDGTWYDAANLNFGALTAPSGDPFYAVIYYNGGGSDALRVPVFLIDISQGTGTPTSPNGTDYHVNWDDAGIFLDATVQPDFTLITVDGGLTRGQWLALSSAPA